MGSNQVPAGTNTQNIELNGQMDPDTFAELLRPWMGDGRTRGPALELTLKNGRTVVPEPFQNGGSTFEREMMEAAEAVYTLTFEGGNGGVGVTLTISFFGDATLLDQLDNRWKEPGRYESHHSYAGLRFRGQERRLIESKRPVRHYVPVFIKLTRILGSSKQVGDLASIGSAEEPRPTPGSSH